MNIVDEIDPVVVEMYFQYRYSVIIAINYPWRSLNRKSAMYFHLLSPLEMGVVAIHFLRMSCAKFC